MSCQNMNKAVKLEEIINVFEMQSDDTMMFLNKITGEVIVIDEY
jgi:hypothetical protein